jgi:hypothetical protein
MLSIPFREIPAPVINYSNGRTLSLSRNTQWDLRGNAFLDRSHPFTGKVVVFVPKNNGDAKSAAYYAEQLLLQLGMNGVKIMRGGRIVKVDPKNTSDLQKSVINPIVFDRSSDREMSFRNGVRQAKSEHPDLSLALLVNPTKKAAWADVFTDFKRVMEQEVGIDSLCITAEACNAQERKGRLSQYMANVSMKLNLKLKNYNHSVQLSAPLKELLDDTIIFGADVTHTKADGPDAPPSLAAVVSSVDTTYGKFLGSLRFQKKGKEASLAYPSSYRAY